MLINYCCFLLYFVPLLAYWLLFFSRAFYLFSCRFSGTFYLFAFLFNIYHVGKFSLSQVSGLKGIEEGRTLRPYILNFGIKRKWVVKLFTLQPL